MNQFQYAPRNHVNEYFVVRAKSLQKAKSNNVYKQDVLLCNEECILRNFSIQNCDVYSQETCT